ncbi:putative fad binding domain-containing protein [Diaporthe ampelina]|uniref:Putative fad binding domain-containing protein n=1 Tax=Diaporthe ampelina TaxID=1214573 RepID=A0A0G2HML7_9PEZI|nr:putative fad binding domain-containing protein [Diaporthe ampelina]
MLRFTRSTLKTKMRAGLELSLTDDTHHWFFESNSETPTCVVEVGSPADVSIAMTAIGSYGAPFAVYSAGHASNKGFSSTSGVHIAMKRMNQVTLSADKSTVEIGTGNGWADVYDKLDGKTNQYGLTSDTVVEFNVVLPNGTISRASEDVNPDLFFALKGGLNRFGVVTSAVYRTHPQTDEVYAGTTIYGEDQIDAVLNATQVFSDVNTDPKAQIITTINATPVGLAALVLFFYDGPDAGTVFEMFDGVDHTISLVRTQAFSTFVSTVDSSIALNPRGTFNSLPTTRTTPAFLAAVKNQASSLLSQGHGGLLLSYDIEPFLKYGAHATESAYPHDDSPCPLNLYFSWGFASDDQFWNDAMVNAVSELRQVAIKEGIFDESSAVYPNYAIAGTTAEQLYGPTNAARLRSIKASVDPDGVMNLAGGFDI